MNYVDSNRGTRHASTAARSATTLCGLALKQPVATGMCIAPLITCKGCLIKLRREGWQR